MTCGKPEQDDKDWGEWRNFVLKELERLNNNQEALREKQEDLRNELTKLKAEIYTTALLISSIVPIIITVVLWVVDRIN